MKSILGAASVTFEAVDDRIAVQTAAKIVRRRIEDLKLDGPVVIARGGRLIGGVATVERMAIFAMGAENVNALDKHSTLRCRRFLTHSATIDHNRGPRLQA